MVNVAVADTKEHFLLALNAYRASQWKPFLFASVDLFGPEPDNHLMLALTHSSLLNVDLISWDKGV